MKLITVKRMHQKMVQFFSFIPSFGGIQSSNPECVTANSANLKAILSSSGVISDSLFLLLLESVSLFAGVSVEAPSVSSSGGGANSA